jgi:hypothetical protein
MAKLKKRIRRLKYSFRKRFLKLVPNVLHIGQRALTRSILLYGQPGLEKHFAGDAEGRKSFEREMLAQQLFGRRTWLVPSVQRRARVIAMPRYKEEQRLDFAVKHMDEATRLEAARQALQIIWEIFDQGYAHRDFHAKNLFWVNGRLIATDFETLEPYPPGQVPPFPKCYDIVGQGLVSPDSTGHMCYTADHPLALQKLLGIPLDQAMEGVREFLKDALREESLSFKSARERHLTQIGRIYASFRLPFFTVEAHEAQRHSARRMEIFGMKETLFKDRRVLDLGCNSGAMLLETLQFEPAFCLGIEYDAEKVALARSLARFNGLKRVEFKAGDVDTLEPEALGQIFDVVFCLAINLHVKNPDRLYDLLGRITGDLLFFEGNAGTDVEDAISRLHRAGFASVTPLGMSDDDCLPKNNKRPMIVARRHGGSP